MDKAAIGVFTLAALLGAVMLVFYVMPGRTIPKGLAILHGLFAVTGFILLLIHAFSDEEAHTTSLVIFGLAALGGGYLFGRDMRNKKVPFMLALGHGVIALTAYLILVFQTL